MLSQHENKEETSPLISSQTIFEFINNNFIDTLLQEEGHPSWIIKMLLVFKYFSDKYQSKILKEYEAAPVIIPPTTLDPLFVAAEQSDESLYNMSLAYIETSIPGSNNQRFDRKNQDTQLFEIPPILPDCKAYCGLGYKTLNEYVELEKSVHEKAQKKRWGYRSEEQFIALKYIKNQLDSWIGERWVQLPITSDFSCHQGFEKIFIYMDGAHYARQWGDGTILSKNGTSNDGAVAVWRVLSPQNDLIRSYGSVESTWIKKRKEIIPAPFFRWQSVPFYSKIPEKKHTITSTHNSDQQSVRDNSQLDNEVYKKAKQTRDQLLTLSRPTTSKRKSWCAFFCQLFYQENTEPQFNPKLSHTKQS